MADEDQSKSNKTSTESKIDKNSVNQQNSKQDKSNRKSVLNNIKKNFSSATNSSASTEIALGGPVDVSSGSLASNNSNGRPSQIANDSSADNAADYKKRLSSGAAVAIKIEQELVQITSDESLNYRERSLGNSEPVLNAISDANNSPTPVPSPVSNNLQKGILIQQHKSARPFSTVMSATVKKQTRLSAPVYLNGTIEIDHIPLPPGRPNSLASSSELSPQPEKPVRIEKYDVHQSRTSKQANDILRIKLLEETVTQMQVKLDKMLHVQDILLQMIETEKTERRKIQEILERTQSSF